jgi:hypothetical protein
VTLGWEPQWVLVKVIGTTGNWTLIDTMRNYSLGGNPSGTNQYLRANTSGAELEAGTGNPTATGFFIDGVVAGSQPHIYIAIRRGPMKVPTVGTSVYNAIARNGTGALVNVTGVGFAPDLVTVKNRDAGYDSVWVDKLRGSLPILASSSTNAEVTNNTDSVKSFNMDGITLGGDNPGTYGGAFNFSTSNSYINWFFRRAPGFLDEVCFTQTTTSGAQAIAHNLTVAPELVIVKPRSQASSSWEVFPVASNNRLNLNAASAASTYAPLSSVTSTSFSYPMADIGWSIGVTYVAYLFATVAGVSKVGSYTGNGTTQTIDCGFTGGARFVLIKRTNASGGWYVYDTARGMTVLTDPYLFLNTADTEVATLGSVTTVSTGFALNSTILAAINVSGGSYIFLAVA